MTILSSTEITTSSSMDWKQQRNLLLFDLKIGGHHPIYIQHLVKYWCQEQVPTQLSIVVSPDFLDLHAEVIQTAENYGSNRVYFIAITRSEHQHLKQQKSLQAKLFAEWNLFCQYARALQASQGLLMYFDHLQLPLVFGQKAPCSVAGIYFRPTFHYQEFSNYVSTLRDSIRQQRQRLLLALALRNPQLNLLFSLDPFAVSHINQLNARAKAVHLPDPIQPRKVESGRVNCLRASLMIQPQRTVFLLFGSLDDRKGIYPLLESIRFLTPEQCNSFCLLLVGRIAASEQAKLMNLITEIAQELPVQIVVHNEFVPESDVSLYYHLADFVLAPYQKHVGMSGILLHAAAAKKPVLSSNYGLMGELVFRYQLGIAVDSTDASTIARGIADMLNHSTNWLYNYQKMEQFVEQNLADKFAKTIFSSIVENT